MVISLQNDYTSPNSASAILATQQNEAVQKAEEMADAAAEKVEAKTGIVLQYNTDRVEISPEGKQEAQQSQKTDEEKAQQPSAQAKPASPPPTAQASSTSQATTTEDTSESTLAANTNLTSLSEQEITTLVQQGSVTQAQADKELARRTASQSENTNTQADATNNVEE